MLCTSCILLSSFSRNCVWIFAVRKGTDFSVQILVCFGNKRFCGSFDIRVQLRVPTGRSYSISLRALKVAAGNRMRIFAATVLSSVVMSQRLEVSSASSAFVHIFFVSAGLCTSSVFGSFYQNVCDINLQF